MTRADGAIVVSIPKSGTHLLAKLMALLGYTVRGVGGEPWTDEERNYGSYWAEKLGLLPELCNSEGYRWAIFNRQRERTGKGVSPCPWDGNRCLIIHELHLNRIDGDLYRRWEETGEPKIIFNHRDPRACLTSYVHFLRDGKDMAPSPIQLAYRKILSRFDSFAAALDYAIRDPNFPGMRNFRDMRWLLHHPDVLNTQYDQLAIPSGSPEALRKVADHLGAKSLDLGTTLFDPTSPTFRSGSIDKWNEEWGGVHHESFDSRYGDILTAYDYPR